MGPYRNFSGGRFIESASAAMIEVRNPATAQVFASVPAATDDEAREAVDAAAKAQRAWAALPAIQRGDALRRLAAVLESRAEHIGAALAKESGKSLADATAEVIYGAELMRYHAEWARRIEGWRGKGLDIHVYFDNDIKVRAPFDAARLTMRLGLPHTLNADGHFEIALPVETGRRGIKAPASR